MPASSLTIVTHCWRFSRVLTYQLSSLVLHPPKKIKTTIRVYFNEQDESTLDTLRYFAPLLTERGVLWYFFVCTLPELWNRTIGRNRAALNCNTDLIWFTDADYAFGEGCLDSLAELDTTQRVVYFPAWSWINNTHELGDQYALQVKEPGLYDVHPEDFKRENYKKAIGGIQIVPGDVARMVGYCNGDVHRLKPAPGGWKQTYEDGAFRKLVGRSQAVEVPELYRIRQLVQWRVDTLGEVGANPIQGASSG
jgi:hypothetical protein